ncbi:MAG: acyl-ACP--UDP-N-acetylglucosamine O-acyltransferase [Planctomycetes bacterium]|nr:acyl-ACP--UDP-N-acetylglucosamine O-acyltransferase [Planctomycetota bacterium]
MADPTREEVTGYRQFQGGWVHETAHLGEGVELSPGAVIGASVTVGAGCRIGENAVVKGPAVLGRENVIYPCAVIGGAPQDLSYQGESTGLQIGDRNTFREGVTINRGAPKGEGLTRIGNDNLLMATCHVGHDCCVEDNCVFANSVLLAGHCHVQSNCTIAGNSAVGQFSTLGRFSFIGGLAGVRKDAEPFLRHDRRSDSISATPFSVNTVGVSRGGFSEEAISALKKAFSLLFRKERGSPLEARCALLAENGLLTEEVEELVEFMRRKASAPSGRHLDLKRH